MSAGPATPLGRTLRRIAAAPDHPDGRLLAAFLTDRDEPAFAELVRRHGPMVLGVCRRVAGNHADADDAFQAAFLVLLRRAAGLLDRATVGDFLYGVAYRTALKARGSAVKRRLKEARAARPEAAPVPAEPPELDRELARLPEKYRAAVVLCDLEERPRKEVAAALGIPEGTLSSRLAAGRKLLAERLRPHGLALPAVGLTAAVSPALANATVDIAAVAAGHAVGAVPPAVGKLVTEVTRTMMMTKLGMAAVVLAGGLAAGAAGLVAGAAGLVAADPPAGKTDAPARKTAEKMTLKQFLDAGKAATDALNGTWELQTRTTGKGTAVKPGDRWKFPNGEGMFHLEYQRWTFIGRQSRTLRIESKSPPVPDLKLAAETSSREVTVTVNPTTDPPQMNVHDNNFLLLGIYNLDGDTLTFGYLSMAELERPKGFDPKDTRVEGLGLIVDVYKRVKQDDAKPKADPPPKPKPEEKERPGTVGPAVRGEPAWKAEFREVYKLADKQVVKLVPAPYPGCREEYVREADATGRSRNPGDWYLGLRDDGRRLTAWLECSREYETALAPGNGRVFNRPVGMPLSRVLESVFGVSPPEVEAAGMAEPFLTRRVDADFVVRAGSKSDEQVAGLAAELRDKFDLPVNLAFHDVEREVIVARGKVASKPRDGRKEYEVDYYAEYLRPDDRDAGNPFDLADALTRLGRYIGRRVVNEAEPLPPGTWLTVREHARWTRTLPQSRLPDDVDPATVLPNVAAQTGLTFTTERRKVRVLFVEPAGE